MSRAFRKSILLLAFVLSLIGRAFATPTPIGSITITGGEQSSGGVFDSGTVTATLNGVSISVAYGQYSNPAAVASALAATISQNCNMPVYAQATGATINFYTKGSNVLSSATVTGTSSNPTLFAASSFGVNGSSSGSPPAISNLSLTEGPPGMGFVITGTNFGSTQGTVTIGGISAAIVPGTWSATSVTVQVPNGLTAGLISYEVIVATSTFNSGTSSFQVDDPFGCN
jgi:hypothetical protein